MTTPARPKYVRITGPANAYCVTVGRVYRVLGWAGTEPVVRRDDRYLLELYIAGSAGSWPSPAWEPCEGPADGPVGEEDPS